jgi:mRNA interferase MazF
MIATNEMIRRGDVYFADLSGSIGSEQGGERPVLIIQNNTGNKYAPTVIIATITGQITKRKLPTHVEFKAEDFGFDRDSVMLGEQLRTIDKKRLKIKLTSLNKEEMRNVNAALKISLGLFDFEENFQPVQRQQLQFA